MVVVLCVVTQTAPAAVTLADPTPANAISCGTGTAGAAFLVFNTPFRLNSPSGAATNDVLLLTIRTYNEANFFGNSVLPNAQSVGWIPLASSATTRSYYRVRLAGDPAQYTVVSVGALVTASAEVEASIVAFSGADTVTPFPNAGDQSSGTATGPLPFSLALPNAGIVRGGSVRYSAVSTDRASTFDYSAATPPLMKACDESNADSSLSTSYELTAPPTSTPAHSIGVGGAASPAWVAQTYVIQPPLSACASGGVSLTAPGSITFPSITLNGLNQTASTTAPLIVNDQTGTLAGWSISGTSTSFTNGVATLPVGATSITGAGAVGLGGLCSLPAIGLLYPMTLPAGPVAPSAIKLVSAGVGTGSGPVTVNLAATLAAPANARVGVYSSTWTLTLGTGP